MRGWNIWGEYDLPVDWTIQFLCTGFGNMSTGTARRVSRQDIQLVSWFLNLQTLHDPHIRSKLLIIPCLFFNPIDPRELDEKKLMLKS